MLILILCFRRCETKCRTKIFIKLSSGLHQIFSSQVQHAKKHWTQSDLRFCENKGQKDLKSIKKGVNWVVNQDEN